MKMDRMHVDVMETVELVEADVIERDRNSKTALSTLETGNDCEFADDSEIIADWLLNKSQITQQTYWGIIGNFFAFADNVSLSAITKKLILSYLQFLQQQGYKTKTINNKLTAIKSLLKHCVAENYLTKNVASNITSVKAEKDDKETRQAVERVAAKNDIKKLLDAAKQTNWRDYLILLVGYNRGLRVHEVCNLHWNDFTFNEQGARVKVIGKNAKVGFINFPQKLVDWLRQLNTTGYIFQSNRNAKMTRRSLHNIVKKYAKKAGINEQISFHWLRHSCASHLANSNIPLCQVRDLLRHSSISVTSQYVHSEEDLTFDVLDFD